MTGSFIINDGKFNIVGFQTQAMNTSPQAEKLKMTNRENDDEDENDDEKQLQIDQI